MWLSNNSSIIPSTGTDHAPLVLRWSDDQLAVIAECLAPLLPDNLTDQMQLAIASIARSIVAEHAACGGARTSLPCTSKNV